MKHDGRAEELKHQGTDVRFPAIIKAAAVFVVVAAFIQAGVWLFYRHVREQNRTRDVRRVFVETKPPVPPEPRLEVNPQDDFQEYLRQQHEILNSYAWTSRADGKVRIPIDRAMELVVERGKAK
jgi:hypothetical protein